MDNENRRLVLATGLVSPFALWATNGLAFSGRPDVLYAGGRYQESPNAPQKFSLTRLEPEKQKRDLTECSFFPHALAIDPTNPSRAIAFEKIGPGAAEFDLKARKMVQTLAPKPGRYFYGHGCFSADGKTLFCTDSPSLPGGGSGAIAIFDGKTLRQIGEMPSHGANPHECELTDGGKVLAVTNGGGITGASELGNLAWVEVATGKLLKKQTVQGEQFNAGHFKLHDGKALVITAPRMGLTNNDLGSIQFALAGQALRHLDQPADFAKKLAGESLSCLIAPELDCFLVTHPTPGLLSVWSLSKASLQQAIELPRVRGIAFSHDKKTLFASYGVQAELALLSVTHSKEKGASFARSKTLNSTVLAGSHLLNHSV